MIMLGGGRGHDAVRLGHDHGLRVARGGPSKPVPTSGDSDTSERHAWRCMFEPISARLASSCSRNGIEAGSHGDQLLRRHVHVVHVRRRDFDELAAGYAR